jgi:hypothetical protein
MVFITAAGSNYFRFGPINISADAVLLCLDSIRLDSGKLLPQAWLLLLQI